MSGTPVTIAQLPPVAVDTADSLAAWDNSAGLTGRYTIAVLQAYLDTVYARLAATQNFTGTNTFDLGLAANGGISSFAFDGGAAAGIRFWANRNSNASTPAPGHILMTQSNNSSGYLWPDSSGVLRIGTSQPTNANQGGGTVVGAQTSSLDAKDIEGEALTPDEVLVFIAEGAAAVRRFRYKPSVGYDEEGNEIVGDRPSGGEEFSGVIVDYAGRYGTDRDEAHPHGKSLNMINAIGDLLIAVNYLSEQLATALLRVEALELAREVS